MQLRVNQYSTSNQATLNLQITTNQAMHNLRITTNQATLNLHSATNQATLNQHSATNKQFSMFTNKTVLNLCSISTNNKQLAKQTDQISLICKLSISILLKVKVQSESGLVEPFKEEPSLWLT